MDFLYWKYDKAKEKFSENQSPQKKMVSENCSKYSLCLSNLKTLCSKQATSTTSFKSIQTKLELDIFHKINCKSGFFICQSVNFVKSSMLEN